jgi:transketolase, bacterial and yeast
MAAAFNELDQRSADTIRVLTVDAVQKAHSGHPGLPLGTADLSYVLWTRFLRHNPSDPHWFNRDRFVLSGGHGSMLLYSLLHLTGYAVSLDELKNFRQWGSITPGHPEVGVTPGVETTTGPLGQGVANGVGIALAEAWLAARYNRPGFNVVDHYTYGIISDGDLEEGISHEAAALAGHLGLGKLIYFYDDNGITIDGPTSLSYSDDVPKRFEAYHWHVQTIDGHDMEAVANAIVAAQAVTDKPSIIITKTIIGKGMPSIQGTQKAHSDAPGEDEVRRTKENLGWPTDSSFYIPEDVLANYRQALTKGAEAQKAWQSLFDAYAAAHPDAAAELSAIIKGELPAGWEAALDKVSFPVDKPIATRAASGAVIDALISAVPQLLGGSADLTPSNNTKPKGSDDISKDNHGGRYIRYGIREHGMSAIMNGLALSSIIPYGGTFLTFSDYAKNAVRLSALSSLQVIYVFTHDSIGLGEDGPTHQPVEHFAGLRAIPSSHFIRPADATETVEAWRIAISDRKHPTILALSRQALPVIDRSSYAPASGVAKGAYILKDAEGGNPDVILIATGSEVSLIIEAEKLLAAKGIKARLVSMPSWDLFEAQPREYRDSVLPPSVTARVSVEAAATLGWERYVGDKGAMVGVNRFGASAPYKDIYKHYGLTPENIVAAAEASIAGKGREWTEEQFAYKPSH